MYMCMASVWIFIFFITIGGYIFLSKYKHLLTMLLSLEVMMLGLYGFMGEMWSLGSSSESILMMMFLVFSVCEGAVGLGLLVMFVRSFGSDYFSNFSSLWS